MEEQVPHSSSFFLILPHYGVIGRPFPPSELLVRSMSRTWSVIVIHSPSVFSFGLLFSCFSSVSRVDSFDFSFSDLIQGVCDHIFRDVKTGPTKILDDGSRFRNPTEPLREDDQAAGPRSLTPCSFAHRRPAKSSITTSQPGLCRATVSTDSSPGSSFHRLRVSGTGDEGIATLPRASKIARTIGSAGSPGSGETSWSTGVGTTTSTSSAKQKARSIRPIFVRRMSGDTLTMRLIGTVPTSSKVNSSEVTWHAGTSARPSAWMKSHRLRPAISAPFPSDIRPRLYQWIAAARRISRSSSSGPVARSSGSASGTWTVIVIVSP